VLRQSIPQNPGQAGKSQVLAFAKLLAGHNVHFCLESGDKVTHATPLASQINAGNVLMLKGAWDDAFKEECKLFPSGGYDDQIDGATRISMGCRTRRVYSPEYQERNNARPSS
jgi:predicted phage terminase large subunit-like protein